MKEYRVYFINAFMEVDSTFPTNEAYPQLKRVGNLFETEEEAIVTARWEDGQWRIEIHNGSSRYSAKLLFVHELQHALSDCFVYWKIIAR